MTNKEVQIANFNCTFTINQETYPMLNYFDQIIFPALTNESFIRRSKDNEYYLSDVKVINLADSPKEDIELALIGLHIKRVKLEIKHDYQARQGFIPIGETKHSAPFSVFILLLKNHRLIQYKDQADSPDIRSFGTTVREFVKQYRRKAIREIINSFYSEDEPSDLLMNVYKTNPDIEQMSKRELKEYLTINAYPEPEINVVPIPSPNIIEQKMKYIKSIQQVNFRVYPLNAELDLSGFYRALRTATTELNAPSGQAVFNGPKDIKTVGEYLKESKGMADFTVYARTENERLKLNPDELIENIGFPVPEDLTLEEKVKYVYNRVKNREEINVLSDDNKTNYDRYLRKK